MLALVVNKVLVFLEQLIVAGTAGMLKKMERFGTEQVILAVMTPLAVATGVEPPVNLCSRKGKTDS